MKILVTGANGQLGSEMRLLSGTSPDEYIFTDIASREGVDTEILDICDYDAFRDFVKSRGIGAVVNCAAYTNVDAAESNPEAAAALNSDAPGKMAAVMKEVGGWFIHISTDYVFGKEKYNTPCTPDMTGTPSGVYGRTKLEGERLVISSGCKYVIIRTSWLYSEFGRNFCRTMLELTSTKDELKVVFDQVGTPTYAGDLAGAIVTILRNPVAGIYHYSNEGVCSWYDFTKMIQEFSGHSRCRVLPCHSSEFPSPVVRPSYSVLDKTGIKETYGLEIPYWTDSLKKCIKNLEK